MIWLGWRQQRTEMVIVAAMLALIALLLVPTGLQMASAFHHDGVSTCLGANGSSGCEDAVQAFIVRFEPIRNVTAWLTLVPGLVGALLAAPFILDLEHGTYRLAWTQSITRRRWIAGKVSLAIGAALLCALALTLLLTWWHGPMVRVQGRMEAATYDGEGIVLFGYMLFALGLAMAVGVVWRRAVPALVVAFVGYFAARLFVDTWLRQRLLKPLTATWGLTGKGPNLDRAWVISQGPSDRFGHTISAPVQQCARAAGPHTKAIDGHCLTQHGAGFMHAVYQPASRFWALQGIETAIFGGVALVLVAFAIWWTNARTA